MKTTTTNARNAGDVQTQDAFRFVANTYRISNTEVTNAYCGIGSKLRNDFKAAMMGIASICVGLLIAGQASAVPVSVFSENFNGGSAPAEFSGITSVVSVQGYAGIGGFSGDFLRNSSTGNPASATTLTLTGLAPHLSVDLNFLLAVNDSWDGFNNGAGPDVFNVTVDGASVFSEVFANDSLADQGFDPTNATGARLSYGSGLGFNGNFTDAAYDLGGLPAFNGIPHTGSTLTVSWFASGGVWQGGSDEAWAIDNVEVIINVIPEPTTVGLLISSGILGILMRRRRFS